MANTGTSEEIRDLRLLELHAKRPETRQVDLSNRLGIAVGSVNWLLNRLTAKGYVKVKRIRQWRWRYLLTPQGVVEKARLTERYLRNSMNLYRRTRREAQHLLAQVKNSGYSEVRVQDDEGNDLGDVCRLTCLEQDVKINIGEEDRVPVLRVEGDKLTLEWPTDGILQSQEVQASSRKRTEDL